MVTENLILISIIGEFMKQLYKSLIVAVASASIASAVAAPTPVFKDSDFEKALWMTGRFYGAQRSGDSHNWLIAKHKVGSYDGTSFVKDADGSYDLTGGWFDCGDHVKFGQTEFYSAYMLALGYSEFPSGYNDYYSQDYNGYVSADDYTWEGRKGKPNGIPDILDELKHATDYFQKVIRDNKTFYYQVGDGEADHHQWVTSVKMSTLGNGDGGESTGSRKVYSGSGSMTDMASLCGATLAVMSRVYKPFDAAYAAKCLEKAKLCHELVYGNALGNTGAGPFYGEKGTFYPDMVVLNMELYRATNDSKYLTQAEETASKFMDGSDTWNHNWTICYTKAHDLAYYLLGSYSDGKYKALAKKYLDSYVEMYKGGRADKCLFAKFDAWGALRYPANQAFLLGLYDKMNGTDELNEWTLRTIEYIMGSNSRKFSYIVGFGDNSPKMPHHRNYYGDDNNNMKGLSADKYGSNSYKYRQFGFLAGGSVKDGYYEESLDSYQYSEGGIDYNAGLVSALGYIVSKLKPVNSNQFGHPSPDLGKSQSICGLESIELDSKLASDGKKTFTWTLDGTEVAKGTDKNKFTATKPGLYVCKVDSAGEWSSEGSVEITGVIPAQEKELSYELCAETSAPLALGIESNVFSYKWSKDEAVIDGAKSSSYSATRGGSYVCTVSAKSCTDVAYKFNVESKLPEVNDTKNGAGGKVTLEVLSDGSDYEWYDKAEGGTLLGTGKTLDLTIKANTTVYVQNAGNASFVAGPKSFSGTPLDWGSVSANFTAHKPFQIEGFTLEVNKVYNPGMQTITVELTGTNKATATAQVEVTKTGDLDVKLSSPLEISVAGDYKMKVSLANGSPTYYGSGEDYSKYQGDNSVLTFTGSGDGNQAGGFPGIKNWLVTAGSGCGRAEAHAIYDPVAASTVEVPSAVCSIYPNPATDVINVSVADEEVESVEIEAMDGSVVMFISDEPSSISVSGLVKGVYVVKATTSNGQYVGKFVKE